MQIIQSKGNIVEKVIRDKAGNLVRAKFFVFESAGRVKARLLEFTYIEEVKSLAGKILSLSVFKKSKVSLTKFFNGNSVSKSFLTNDILAFSGSKPRAPTF